jgi:hypothetical protein
MGMVMGLEALTDADIERLHADPPLVWLIVAPDDPEPYEEERAKASKGLLGKLFGKARGIRPHPPAGTSPFSGGRLSCDLDKAWEGVHYLFTGTSCKSDADAPTGTPSASAFPLDFLIRDSRFVGDIEVGYGQARTFSPAEMRAVHEAMRPFTDEVLESRYDPEDMMKKEVYPEVWDREDEDNREWVVDAAKDLRQFVADCAEKGCGCLIYLT